jgi:hypothetical protein
MAPPAVIEVFHAGWQFFADSIVIPLRRFRGGVFVRVGHDFAHFGGIKFAFPAADDQGGNAVADYIGEGTALAHELFDAHEKRKALHRNRGDSG